MSEVPQLAPTQLLSEPSRVVVQATAPVVAENAEAIPRSFIRGCSPNIPNCSEYSTRAIGQLGSRDSAGHPPSMSANT
jgi:hypothetical protein